ncbi:MAG: tRNA (adenosine(37)-N6)-threonylcarbamoyltransferase complex ATPase subunit type 1 TsaE [Deltaproteobacteria bacterium]|nr:tRNA (adenosine(37)-N6)-threonylcarbamoyltransferase complex ATPase subunit type 1 TsaE [Deltaproteobacteria bacterium]
MPVDKLWTKTISLNDLGALGFNLATELMAWNGEHPFCLWLIGPLGVGKTTITGEVLRQLGLPRVVPVTSPTYTYMNEYEIDGHWYAHLDLYRSNSGLSSEDLGLADVRPYRGLFVEWPELKADDPYLRPTHTLELDFGPNSDERKVSFSRVNQ